MKISVILGHPKKGSFNHAIAQAVVDALHKNLHEVFYHDLYDERFDPILDHGEMFKECRLSPAIKLYCKEISGSDAIIIVHPNWWGQPPAILKGWIDRVLRPGVAYDFLDGNNGEGVPKGLLRAKTALIFNTSNTPSHREMKVFGDPLSALWEKCIFNLCGVKDVRRKMYNVIVASTPKQREMWLQDVTRTVNRFFPPDSR